MIIGEIDLINDEKNVCGYIICLNLLYEKDYIIYIQAPDNTLQGKINSTIADTAMEYLYRCHTRTSSK